MTEPQPDLTMCTVTSSELHAIMTLTRACDLADTGEVDFDPVDVEVTLTTAGTRAWALAAADGSLQALSWVSREPDVPSQSGEFFVHPSQPVDVGAAVLDAMIAAMPEDVARRKLHVMVAANAPDKSALLIGRGAIVVRHFFKMAMALDSPLPDPVWPAGAVLSTVDDTDDHLRPVHLALSEAFEDHWEHRTSTYDEWQQRHRSRPDFDPSLWWFVAVDGVPAAAIACFERSSGGFVGAIGVRRPYRGTGLARQLLMQAFAEFKRRGWGEASLFVDGANPTGAVRLYESVGMHRAAQWDCHEFGAS